MEKILALANYLQINYFKHNGEYYIGTTQKEYEDFEKKELENEEDTKTAFDEWIDSEYSTLKEEIINIYGNHYKYGREEYLVLTNTEADNEAYDYTYNIWEECYLTGEVKKQLGFLADYINLDQATRDAIQSDGRGNSLSSYDGKEYKETINNVTHYIYRTN